MDSENIAEQIASNAIIELESKRKSLTDNEFSAVFKMALNDNNDQTVLKSVIKKIALDVLKA